MFKRSGHQSGDVVRGRIDDGIIDDDVKRQIGNCKFRGDPFALGIRGETRQRVAGLRLVRLRQEFAKIGELEPLAANRVCERTHGRGAFESG